ncbi:hypothetical protein Tco_0122292 [Tanacetum coccineum]
MRRESGRSKARLVCEASAKSRREHGDGDDASYSGEDVAATTPSSSHHQHLHHTTCITLVTATTTAGTTTTAAALPAVAAAVARPWVADRPPQPAMHP